MTVDKHLVVQGDYTDDGFRGARLLALPTAIFGSNDESLPVYWQPQSRPA